MFGYVRILDSDWVALLIFPRNQGAMVSGVLPEALLDYHNYVEWLEQKFKSRDIVGCKDENSFREVSEKAWTCVLVQAIKVTDYPCVINIGAGQLHDNCVY